MSDFSNTRNKEITSTSASDNNLYRSTLFLFLFLCPRPPSLSRPPPPCPVLNTTSPPPSNLATTLSRPLTPCPHLPTTLRPCYHPWSPLLPPASPPHTVPLSACTLMKLPHASALIASSPYPRWPTPLQPYVAGPHLYVALSLHRHHLPPPLVALSFSLDLYLPQPNCPLSLSLNFYCC
ncbi:hypothetical protein Sjap_008279 [Stephania japonica]|uniref:Uncharacterized protein n=1 Tax=Stephania japonica TaxID=461633 RepID=A0AAP0JRG4_9MAGN